MAREALAALRPPAAPPGGRARARSGARSSNSASMGGEGLPVPIERRCWPSAGRMPKRGQHRATGGQDARSERPARWHGQPRAASPKTHRPAGHAGRPEAACGAVGAPRRGRVAACHRRRAVGRDLPGLPRPHPRPIRSAERHRPETHWRNPSILSPAVTATGTTFWAATATISSRSDIRTFFHGKDLEREQGHRPPTQRVGRREKRPAARRADGKQGESAAGMPCGDGVRTACAVRQCVPTGGTVLENKDEGYSERSSSPRNESHPSFRSGRLTNMSRRGNPTGRLGDA